jgi:hypothetical protein
VPNDTFAPPQRNGFFPRRSDTLQLTRHEIGEPGVVQAAMVQLHAALNCVMQTGSCTMSEELKRMRQRTFKARVCVESRLVCSLR